MQLGYLKPALVSSLKGYDSQQLVKDIIAGIIVAIIALPLSIALALASGVQPACGVYTAIFAGLAVALLGGSQVQIAGPTAAFATVVAGIVAVQGMDGLLIATVMAGLLLVAMGVFKLGSLIRYIPFTVTTGFTAGIAITIVAGEIKDWLGLTYAPGVQPIETMDKLIADLQAITTISWQAVLVGVVCLAILILYPRVEKHLPPSLVAVVVGVAMVQLIPGLNDGVYTIGELYNIPAGLPAPVLGQVDFSLQRIIELLPDAVTIAVLAAIESLLSCVVADGMISGRHRSNAELVAQGVGNIASVLFGGIPATGAIARTAANIKNGGRTPVSGIVHALVLLVVLLFAMPYAGLIPMPTIAAILLMVAYNMSQWRVVVHTIKTAPYSDTLVMLATLVLTVVFDLVVAIAVGMVLAGVLLIRRLSAQGSLHPSTQPQPEGTLAYDLTGPLFFGVVEELRSLPLPAKDGTLLLDMSAVNALDAAAMQALGNLARSCNEQGARLRLVGAKGQPLLAMQKAGLQDLLCTLDQPV